MSDTHIRIEPRPNGRYDVTVDGAVIHKNVGPRQAADYRLVLEDVIGQAYARGYFRGLESARKTRAG